MWNKLLLALVASGFALGACAQQGADNAPSASAAQTKTAATNASAADAAPADAAAQQKVAAAVRGLSPDLQVDYVGKSPLPGFYQVIAAGQLVYISADGKYMIHGDLVDLGAHRNLSDAAWAAFRKSELAKVPAAQRIVYAPAHPQHTITVFTDVNCGYCRALHKHMAEFNQAGIAVEYVAWPREGVTTTAGNDTPTYKEMVSVWCASDRKRAFDEATAGTAPKAATCANPVKAQFDLGIKLGVSGTPTIVAEDGRLLGGYLAPDELLKALKSPGAG